MSGLAEFASEALSSDQPARRARVRQVAHDVLEGMKPFAWSSFDKDQAVINGLQKALTPLLKDTEPAMNPEELKAAITTARDRWRAS